LLVQPLLTWSSESSPPATERTSSQALIKEFVRRKNLPSLNGASILAAKSKYWAKRIGESEGDHFSHSEPREILKDLIDELDLADVEAIMETFDAAEEYGLVDDWVEQMVIGEKLPSITNHDQTVELLGKVIMADDLESGGAWSDEISDAIHNFSMDKKVSKSKLNLTLAAHSDDTENTGASKKVVKFAKHLFKSPNQPCTVDLMPLLKYISKEGSDDDDWERNAFCEYLFSRKKTVRKCLISDAVYNQHDYSNVRQYVAPLLSLASYERLVNECKFDKNKKDIYSDYLTRMRAILLNDSVQQQEDGAKCDPGLFYFALLPNDIKGIIIAHCPVFELLYVLPIVCKLFNTIISKDFVLTDSRDYPRLILDKAKQFHPKKLFCYHYVNTLFGTVHDLVKYRFLQNPDTMEPEWLSMIGHNFSEYKSYPNHVKRSFDTQSREYAKLPFQYSPAHITKYNVLCEMFSEQEGYEREIIAELSPFEVVGMILSCKEGWRLLKAALDSNLKYNVWSRLMFMEKGGLSDKIIVILKEFNEANEFGDCCVPFSAEEVRDNFKIFSGGSFDNWVCIIKAFAAVGFKDVDLRLDPCRLQDIIKHPTYLSEEEFKGLVSYFEKRGSFQSKSSFKNSMIYF
jgi:hypothetical protein